ncbi:phospholipase [Streptomyces sp. NBC_01363]|uniref:phospholipase n=1 Tax=Streptomyces sp. NBC_01363 TaxID=2903840 RepID=UPI0022551735|nr:phospholipase [Streptomyces sp. NBC_01363]MCX4733319.1 phospholipase [Streptomyces sp. NBC_01363]
MRRFTAPLAAVALTLPALFLSATDASAAPADKGQVLSSWTQTSASSYNAWNAARANQANWSAYGFDWSTDYCSTSPDNPFGFPFKNACARHDFGYRNYKAAGTFDANKARLDSAFYEDLKRVCDGYSGVSGTACDGTAWTYYQAVSVFGYTKAVDGSATA